MTSINTNTSLQSRSINKTERGTPIVSANDNSNKDLFLKLLVAQMKNQDPFNSQDPTQYVTQLAQFNMLEQSMSLNKNMETMINLTNGVLTSTAMGNASNLIGKNIEASVSVDGQSNNTEETKTISGQVESVKVKDGVVYMNVKDSQSGNTVEVEYGSLSKVNN